MPAEVQKDKCEGCQDCIPVCPQSCINIEEEGNAFITKEDCIDCNACVDACTKGAIEMK